MIWEWFLKQSHERMTNEEDTSNDIDSAVRFAIQFDSIRLPDRIE